MTMAPALQTDILLQSVGSRVQNHHGTEVGEIIEVTRSKDNNTIHYFILQSNHSYGEEKQYFAIPAASSLVKITQGGKIILLADKEALKQAKGLSFDRCPKPSFKFKPSIYELYQYEEPNSHKIRRNTDTSVQLTRTIKNKT